MTANHITMQQDKTMNQAPISPGYSPGEVSILNLWITLDRNTQVNLLEDLKRLIDWDEPVPAKPPYQWAREGDRQFHLPKEPA